MGGGVLQGRRSGRFGPLHFRVSKSMIIFSLCNLQIMLIYFIVFQEAAILSAIRSNSFEKFLYKIEATKQKKINRMH